MGLTNYTQHSKEVALMSICIFNKFRRCCFVELENTFGSVQVRTGRCTIRQRVDFGVQRVASGGYRSNQQGKSGAREVNSLSTNPLKAWCFRTSLVAMMQVSTSEVSSAPTMLLHSKKIKTSSTRSFVLERSQIISKVSFLLPTMKSGKHSEYTTENKSISIYLVNTCVVKQLSILSSKVLNRFFFHHDECTL